jgi:Lar family restriction alleviation protein
MLKLKPCPFCGHQYKGKMIANHHGPSPFDCPSCGAEGPYLDHGKWKKAKTIRQKNRVCIEAWNRRA